jgi:hypothetical protein
MTLGEGKQWGPEGTAETADTLIVSIEGLKPMTYYGHVAEPWNLTPTAGATGMTERSLAEDLELEPLRKRRCEVERYPTVDLSEDGPQGVCRRCLRARLRDALRSGRCDIDHLCRRSGVRIERLAYFISAGAAGRASVLPEPALALLVEVLDQLDRAGEVDVEQVIEARVARQLKAAEHQCAKRVNTAYERGMADGYASAVRS